MPSPRGLPLLLLLFDRRTAAAVVVDEAHFCFGWRRWRPLVVLHGFFGAQGLSQGGRQVKRVRVVVIVVVVSHW